MATRSMIGIVQHDGSVRAIYCHWDGDLNGRKLLKYYNDEAKINELMDLGDISQLGELIYPVQENAVPEYNLGGGIVSPTPHSYDHPHPNVTIAYCRDRGERKKLRRYPSEQDFYNVDLEGDHYYLFKDGKWHLNKEEL